MSLPETVKALAGHPGEHGDGEQYQEHRTATHEPDPAARRVAQPARPSRGVGRKLRSCIKKVRVTPRTPASAPASRSGRFRATVARSALANTPKKEPTEAACSPRR